MRRRYTPTSELPVTVFEVMARLADCRQLRWITPSESWQSNERRYRGTWRYEVVSTEPYRSEYVTTPANPALPVEYSTSYGDWTELDQHSELKPDTFIIPDYCGGSDYSGSLVEVSNHRALVDALQAAELEDGTDYITYHGGHGTFAVAIRVSSLIDTTDCESIIEMIEGLDDYPVIDESLNSELEIESQNEAWEDWGKSEFTKELARYLAADIRAGCESDAECPAMLVNLPCTESLAEYCEDGDWVEDNAGLWCSELAEYANEYWVNEQGSDSYLDMADVVKHGFTRELHWAKGTAKRDGLVRDIKLALESAYSDHFYSELAANLTTPQHGFTCNRTWQHDAVDCPANQ